MCYVRHLTNSLYYNRNREIYFSAPLVVQLIPWITWSTISRIQLVFMSEFTLGTACFPEGTEKEKKAKYLNISWSTAKGNLKQIRLILSILITLLSDLHTCLPFNISSVFCHLCLSAPEWVHPEREQELQVHSHRVPRGQKGECSSLTGDAEHITLLFVSLLENTYHTQKYDSTSPTKQSVVITPTHLTHFSFAVSRPELAPEHTRVRLAAWQRRHPAATDEGGEVQPSTCRGAAHHRLHPHFNLNVWPLTSALNTHAHTGLNC